MLALYLQLQILIARVQILQRQLNALEALQSAPVSISPFPLTQSPSDGQILPVTGTPQTGTGGPDLNSIVVPPVNTFCDGTASDTNEGFLRTLAHQGYTVPQAIQVYIKNYNCPQGTIIPFVPEMASQ